MTQSSSNKVPHAWRPKEDFASSNWAAPEHQRVARSMIRDYPRDDWGRRIPNKPKELKVDIRPTSMIPPTPVYKIKPL